MKVGDLFRTLEIEHPVHGAPKEVSAIRKADGPDCEPWTFGRFVRYAKPSDSHLALVDYRNGTGYGARRIVEPATMKFPAFGQDWR